MALLVLFAMTWVMLDLMAGHDKICESSDPRQR
jgi:hypothetical protein